MFVYMVKEEDEYSGKNEHELQSMFVEWYVKSHPYTILSGNPYARMTHATAMKKLKEYDIFFFLPHLNYI